MKKKSSDRFFIVLAIVTFIIIVTGATFAYFTASARSEETAVNTSSHFVQIDYVEGNVMSAIDLIPADKEVAMLSYHGMKETGGDPIIIDNPQCIDDNNMVICSTYNFEVTNLGSIEQHMGAFITATSNQFTNLKYALFNVTDVSEDDTIIDKYNKKTLISTGDLPITYTQSGSFTGNGMVYVIGAEGQVSQTLAPNDTKKYEILIWLEDTGEPQDEQGKTFKGKVTVSLTDQEHIYGYIEKADIQ